jgi:hypothetical protein
METQPTSIDTQRRDIMGLGGQVIAQDATEEHENARFGLENAFGNDKRTDRGEDGNVHCRLLSGLIYIYNGLIDGSLDIDYNTSKGFIQLPCKCSALRRRLERPDGFGGRALTFWPEAFVPITLLYIRSTSL